MRSRKGLGCVGHDEEHASVLVSREATSAVLNDRFDGEHHIGVRPAGFDAVIEERCPGAGVTSDGDEMQVRFQ